MLRCGICDVEFTDDESARRHFLSDKHRAAVSNPSIMLAAMTASQMHIFEHMAESEVDDD